MAPPTPRPTRLSPHRNANECGVAGIRDSAANYPGGVADKFDVGQCHRATAPVQDAAPRGEPVPPAFSMKLLLVTVKTPPAFNTPAPLSAVFFRRTDLSRVRSPSLRMPPPGERM